MAGFFDFVGAPLRGIGLEPSTIPGVGGMFGDPAADQTQKHIKQLVEQYNQSRRMFPEARLNALRMQSQAMIPMNRFAGAVAGPGAMVQTGGMFRNPFPAGHPSNMTPEQFRQQQQAQRPSGGPLVGGRNA